MHPRPRTARCAGLASACLCFLAAARAQPSEWRAPLSNTTWALRLLNSSSAVCLDGSRPGYYARLGAQSDKVVFHLQGGGWCYNETSCEARAKTPLGSSSSWTPTNDFSSMAFFSNDTSINTLTHNWTTVFAKYCSGDSFAGFRRDPVPVPGGGTVMMRGRSILSTILADAMQQVGLGTAGTVLIGGCSAGGLASILHSDAIREALPRARVVKTVTDAGYFLDADTVSGVLRHRQLVQYEARMFNVSGDTTNSACAAQYPGELWRCMMAQYVLPHVATPLFLFQSQYDTFQLQNYFAPTWLPNISQHWASCVSHPDTCSIAERRALRSDWLGQMVRDLRGGGALSEPPGRPRGRGAFVHSCFMHCGLGTDQFVNLTIGGVSLRQAISEWVAESPSPAGGSFIHHEGPWPGNPFCPVA